MQNTSIAMLNNICNCAKYAKHLYGDAKKNMQNLKSTSMVMLRTKACTSSVRLSTSIFFL